MSSNRKPMFLVGLPTNGQHSYLFTQALLGTQYPTNFSMEWRAVPKMEVGDARNVLMQTAIDIGAKYLVTIDEDTIPPSNWLRTLLYRMETHPEWTVCGGLYCTKTYPPEPLLFKEWGQGPYWGWKLGELVRVKGTGAGCHAFRISDLKKLEKPREYALRNPWSGHTMKVREWFKTDKDYISDEFGKLKETVMNTEDSWLYQMLDELDMQVWVDTAILCMHYDAKSDVGFSVPLDNDIAVKPDAWNHEPRMVNLGAGSVAYPYSINVDLREAPGIFCADIRKLPDEWAEQFDIANASQVLEHFPYWQLPKILAEWIRVLKPGGKLTLDVPDLQWALENLNAGFEDPRIMGAIYGDQGDPYWNQGPYGGFAKDGRFLDDSYDHNTHRSGFTVQSIGKLLHSCGLVKISGYRRDGWIVAEAYKKEAQVDPPSSGLPGTGEEPVGTGPVPTSPVQYVGVSHDTPGQVTYSLDDETVNLMQMLAGAGSTQTFPATATGSKPDPEDQDEIEVEG